MGKLSAIADRIRDTKARLDAEADKLAARMDDIDKAAPVAFSRGHAFLSDQQAQVDEIEGTLRQLSNLPLDVPATLPVDSGPTPGPSDHAAFVRRNQQQ